MTTHEFGVGNLFKIDAVVLAEKAARHIGGFGKGVKRAITVDPRGRVQVEPVRSAAEGDLVGVYASERVGAWIHLAAVIERDLKHELSLRTKRRAA